MYVVTTLKDVHMPFSGLKEQPVVHAAGSTCRLPEPASPNLQLKGPENHNLKNLLGV